MSPLSKSVIKRQMLRGPMSHVCACIQVSTGEVEARSLSEHQANTTRHERTRCNVIASWSNVIHEPPSPLVTYRFNAHCEPCPSQIRHLLCQLQLSKAARELETHVQHYCPETSSDQQQRWRRPAPWSSLRSLLVSQQSPAVPRHGVGWGVLGSSSTLKMQLHLNRVFLVIGMATVTKHARAFRLVTWWPGADFQAAFVAIIIWSNVTLERKHHREANVTWSNVAHMCLHPG